MDDARYERYALLGAPVFVVLAWMGAILPGSPPAPGDSAEDVLAYFKDNDTMVGLATFLAVLAAVALLFWAGTLWRRMRAAEGGNPRLTVVAGLGLLLSVAMALASGAVNGAIALQPDALGPDGAQVLYALSATLAASLWAGTAAQVLAVSLVGGMSGLFPRWIVVLGDVTFVVALIAGYGVASDSDTVFGAGFVGFILWSVWLLATSASMWKAAPEPAGS